MRAIANGGARRAENASPARTALTLGTRQRVFLQFAALAFFSSLLASCATPKDVQHHVVISVKDQKLALLDHEKLVAIYPVSTSKYGLGDWRGSFRTPLGEMEIAVHSVGNPVVLDLGDLSFHPLGEHRFGCTSAPFLRQGLCRYT